MARTNDAAFLGSRGHLLSVAAAAGLLTVLSAALPHPVGAASMVTQGPVGLLTDVSEMGLNPSEARFDEVGVVAGDPIPLDLYGSLGLTFQNQQFATIGIQDRAGWPSWAPHYIGPGSSFGPPIAGGGSQTGLVCETCGVATVTGGPTRFGLTASGNGTQYLTVWDTAGYIIGQVDWDPGLGDSAFVGLDTRGVPIGFVAYGNDNVWNGEYYNSSGGSTYSDTWLWQDCGNGIIDAGEQCDDGNVDSADCCDAGCQLEAVDSPCDTDPVACEDRTCDGAGTCVTHGNSGAGTACNLDANACSVDQCDGAGNCLYHSDLDCDDANPCTQDSCVPASGCLNAATPASSCKSEATASVLLSSPAEAAKRRVTFVWTKGASELAAFGDIATTDYTLCVYSDNAVVVRLTAPAAATCGTSPCWSMIGAAGKEKGVVYKDKSKVAEHDGIKLLLGKADDGVAGKATVKLQASGVNIPALSMGAGLPAPVAVQLVTSNAGCWAVEFQSDNATKDNSVTYKAKRTTGG